MWIFAISGCAQRPNRGLRGPPAQATFLQIEGHRVRYIDEGIGPPVFLIHGFGSSLEVWGDVRKKLTSAHRVIAIDLLGFGHSDRPRADYSPRAQARRLVAVMDRLRVKTTALVAHSWGAAIALTLTLEYPERVTRLAVYNAWVYSDQLPTLFYWSRVKGLGEAIAWLFYAEDVERRLEQSFYNQDLITFKMVEDAEHNMTRDHGVDVTLAVVRGQRFETLETRYHTIKQPTLILWGREDHISLLSTGVRLSDDLPHAHLKVFERCGHFTMLEAPRSTQHLLTFLAQGAPS